MKIILDTALDTVRCYECGETIEPVEPKTIIGYGTRNEAGAGSLAIWHQSCYRQLESEYEDYLDL
jgi:hypothetical protein